MLARTFALVFASTLALLGGGCSGDQPGAVSGSASSAAAGPLQVGSAAPAISLTLQDGKKVDLASLKGKFVLVYFYPKDDTKGCTIEAEGIKDGWAKFQEAGIEVYGVSTQDASSHQAFIEKYDLPFPLVVDTDGAVAKAFTVPLKDNYAARQSFLIGKDGKVLQIWRDVVPAEHADSVLKAAKS